MKTKQLFIGAGILAIGTGVYLFLKNKRNQNQVGILDDENIEFDYNNVGGDLVTSGIKSGLESKLSVIDYDKSIAQALNDKKYAIYLGKKIYTATDNVNIRMGANVNNGFFSNIAGKIPTKKTFIGKVVTAKLGDDKKIWFAVNEENSNKLYEIKKNFNWNIYVQNDPSLRWVRSDVVLVKLDKK